MGEKGGLPWDPVPSNPLDDRTDQCISIMEVSFPRVGFYLNQHYKNPCDTREGVPEVDDLPSSQGTLVQARAPVDAESKRDIS